MKAIDVMSTNPVVVRQEATVREAIELMLRTGHHHLPVVNEQGALVGLLNQFTLIKLCLPSYAEQIGDLAFLPDDFEPFDHRMEELGQVAVQDVMDPEPPVATEDTSLVELAALISLRSVKVLPVVRDNVVVGIVGVQDVVREIVHPHAHDSASEAD